MAMRLSLILPVHAKPNRLRLTLAAVSGQVFPEPFETIIVNDGASREVQDIIDNLNFATTVLCTGGKGRAAARNMGAAAAAGNILVFLDDDILIGPDFLNRHLQAHAPGPALVHGRLRELIGLSRVDDPREGGPGCPPISARELELGCWRADMCRTAANALERAAELYFQGLLDVEAPWLAGAGANISVTKDLWRFVGGFDDTFGLRWGMEDLDFAFRLHQSGCAIRFDKTACGYHMSHYNADRWNDHKVNLDMFAARAGVPEAAALAFLLAPDGSPERYVQAVHQMRKEATPISP